ncbi:MAG: cob(I)yrinic acid a,c-diamide adenosyltransferase [SAR202 cluster bacterium]|nr:cob(I)yrinic acid a,c-diamide adenosyltransferase [SAR202 cluster bacterium]|tara:strand:- start:2789 stop:3367 length:579 start_codon:yes stop_codon:yes gene_type:complete
MINKKSNFKIYTKQGDAGETGLLYGGRISKSDLRTEAYGTTDEAISCLGLARATSSEPKLKDITRRIQRELFTVGAELATDREEYPALVKNFSIVTEKMTLQIESDIDSLEQEIILPRSFIIPGASPASSAFDIARAIVRRAERCVVEMNNHNLIENQEVLKYINRVSDLIFIMARYEDRKLPLDVLTGDKD